MKKILTTILTAALLVSSAGCQMKQPQATHSEPEPALQALVLNVDLPSDISGERIDTSAVIDQITAGLKVKLDTAEREKEAAQSTPKPPLQHSRMNQRSKSNSKKIQL